MQNNTSKLNTVLIVVIIALLGYVIYINSNKDTDDYQIPVGDTQYEQDNEYSYPTDQTNNTADTYTYKNHGITFELPKGFVVNERQSEGGPATIIPLPDGAISYYSDASWWEKNIRPDYLYIKDMKIGDTVFKLYEYHDFMYYWFKQGNVGYEFGGDESLLNTFKFVGWQ